MTPICVKIIDSKIEQCISNAVSKHNIGLVPSRGGVAGVKLQGPGLKRARENFAIAK